MRAVESHLDLQHLDNVTPYERVKVLSDNSIWHKGYTWIKVSGFSSGPTITRQLSGLSKGADKKLLLETGHTRRRKEVLSWDAATKRAKLNQEVNSDMGESPDASATMDDSQWEDSARADLSPESDIAAQEANEADEAEALLNQPDTGVHDMTDAATDAPAPAKKSTAKKSTAKKSTAKKSTAKKTTAKKSTASAAKKSTAKKTTAAKPATTQSGAPKRERGGLELDVKSVTDAYVAGEIDLEGKPLTPHRIAALIGSRDEVSPPSTGAVSNIVRRWGEIGFALVNDSPLAFKKYTAKGEKDGLDAVKAKAKEKAKAAK